jgi:hypothetical protein
VITVGKRDRNEIYAIALSRMHDKSWVIATELTNDSPKTSFEANGYA